ncbi:MAG: hypothetical protein ABSB84_03765 [Verrucomicrobiota bacterium]|jgi:hypothetical protein
MKDKLLTLKELEENLWWWKRKENRADLERIKLFGYELAARNYELMRRSPNAGEYQENYLHLGRENKTATAIAWGDPNEFPNRVVFDLQKQEEIGWTSARPHLQWNLQLSNRTLIKAFLEYITQHRNVQKISGSSSLKGKPANKPPSWLYIEFLDMRQNEISGMDDSQRGMASKAEDMAAQFLSEFKIAMAKKDEMVKEMGFYEGYDDFSEEVDF